MTAGTARVLGLLGGMAWPSTEAAYRRLNQRVNAARGGRTTPELLLWSADFEVVGELQSAGDWDAAGELLADAAQRLAAAGAGALVLLTNTMHRVAPAIEARIDVPLLHVADATAAACRDAGATTVGLVGTRFTMEEQGVRDRLAQHGLEVLVPGATMRERIHRHIYDELVAGEVTDRCRATMAEAAASLVEDGAGAVIAGCTEIELALQVEDVAAAYVPTTATLMDAAVAWILEGQVPPAP